MVFIFLLFQIIFLFIPFFPSIYDYFFPYVILQPLYNRENYYISIYIYICFITEIILRVVQFFFMCAMWAISNKEPIVYDMRFYKNYEIYFVDRMRNNIFLLLLLLLLYSMYDFIYIFRLFLFILLLYSSL